jgi:hypothetical protein
MYLSLRRCDPGAPHPPTIATFGRGKELHGESHAHDTGVASRRRGIIIARGILAAAALTHGFEDTPRVLRRRQGRDAPHRVFPQLVLGARQRHELAPPRRRYALHEPIGKAPTLEELAHRMFRVVAESLVDDPVVGARRIRRIRRSVHREPRPLHLVRVGFLGRRHAGAGGIPAARDHSSDGVHTKKLVQVGRQNTM